MTYGPATVSFTPGIHLPGVESHRKDLNAKQSPASSQASKAQTKMTQAKASVTSSFNNLKEKVSTDSIKQVATAAFACAALAIVGVGIYRAVAAIPSLFAPVYIDQLHQEVLDSLRGVNKGVSFAQNNQNFMDYLFEQSPYRHWPQSGKDYVQECLNTDSTLAASATEYLIKKAQENRDSTLLKTIRKTCANADKLTASCAKAQTLLADKLADNVKMCRKSNNAFCLQAKHDQLVQSIQNVQQEKAALASLFKNDQDVNFISQFIQSDLFANHFDDQFVQSARNANQQFLKGILDAKKEDLTRSIKGYERKIASLCLAKDSSALAKCSEGHAFLEQQLEYQSKAALSSEEKLAKIATANSIKRECKKPSTLCTKAKNTAFDLALDPALPNQNWLAITKLLADRDSSPEFAAFVELSCQTFLNENPTFDNDDDTLEKIFWDLQYGLVFDKSAPIKIANSLANALLQLPSSPSYEKIIELFKNWEDKCKTSGTYYYDSHFSQNHYARELEKILSKKIKQLESNRKVK